MSEPLQQSPRELILSRLEGVTATSKPHHWIAYCPACKHRKKKLSITESAIGKVSIQCWRQCDYLEILDAIGLKAQDLYPRDGTWEPAPGHRGGRANVDYRALFEVAMSDLLRVLLYLGDILAGRPAHPDDLATVEAAYERMNATWRLFNA